MIQFARLRLSGFKSFVDKTTLEIGPGLTGIVGPNGCGKSNLVEALRWSMGESSAKRMRGDSRSMEDVIFNGTQTRPARSMAEVSILLDNSSHTAPAPHTQTNELEITRRIEKDRGSGYRINGKPVRARDVQILFADITSGANSPFLVSQGKVTELIKAKPAERRRVLEEAAGISGLYARRHEAEIRLRATDNNLSRLEDMLGSLQSRQQTLKRQVRQAQRYRELNERIRRHDKVIAACEWRLAHDALQTVQKQFDEAEKEVAEYMTSVSQLTRTQNTQSADLPELRKAQGELAASLQYKRLRLERLADELDQIKAAREKAAQELARAHDDHKHEEEALREYNKQLQSLTEEEGRLQKLQVNETETLEKALKKREEAQAIVTDLEEAYRACSEKLAASKAQRDTLLRREAQENEKLATLKARLENAQKEKTELESRLSADDKTSDLKKEAEALSAAIVRAQDEITNYESKLSADEEALKGLEEILQESRNKKNNLDSQINSLKSIVEAFSQGEFEPVLGQIHTNEGYEKALSRALGDGLMAGLDPQDTTYWRILNHAQADMPALPKGIEPIANYVKAPQALGAALSQIGVAKNESSALEAASALQTGQMIVTTDGGLWRWDGYISKADAPDSHAVQIAQKKRLQQAEKELPKAVKALETSEKDHQTALKALQETKDKLRSARSDLSEKQAEWQSVQTALQDNLQKDQAQRTRLAQLDSTIEQSAADMSDLQKLITEIAEELSGMDEAAIEQQAAEAEARRAEIEDKRGDFHRALQHFNMLHSEQDRRKARLHAIADERITLQNRIIRAGSRMEELAERAQTLKEQAQETTDRPAEIQEEQETLREDVEANEKEHRAVSDKLASYETELAETTQALKDAEARLMDAKEKRAHAMATAAERKTRLSESVDKINTQYDLEPSALFAELSGVFPDTIQEDSSPLAPILSDSREAREQAARDRDMMGPVNLQADDELAALEEELGGIINEHEDLTNAVAELRQGIDKLNNEARDRLKLAFDQVNHHFREMFGRLFIGGRAHLSLIESDDPLEAGLEIFAQPPGKTLQSLSLLSGGEQTLTAVALIFAMFMTNPSPICVLDEVDAPLDDANVDRFCDLLEEFAERGETRFLIITHHRMTMARMDRLYGVTMAERGVSKLVSLDLNTQFDFLEAAE